MSSLTTDPDERALLYIMQWMSERGYSKALGALEQDSGVLYDDGAFDIKASGLMQLVWQEVEQELADEAEGDVELARRAEKERLLSGGSEDYAQTRTHVIEGAHPAAIICCKLLPGAEQVLTGSGDGVVRMLSFDGQLLWSTSVGAGAVLSLDVHPNYNYSAQPLLLASSMGGSTHVLHGASGALLASSQPHAKYTVRALWSPDGAFIASGSHDQSLVLQRVLQLQPAGSAAAEQHSSGASGGGGGGVSVELVKQVPMSTIVTDLVFVGSRLLAAARDTNMLRMWQLPGATTSSSDSAGQPATPSPPSTTSSSSAGALTELAPVNLNERGDAHVSFTARALALSPAPSGSETGVGTSSSSPSAPYLLVATDTARVLVLRTSDWSHLANLFGPPVDKFFNPAVAWHRDEHYVYCIGPAAEVLVFHVGSGRVAARLAGHRINVRGLDYDARSGRLATCSFDKTVAIYE